jgi:hypothetical protein
MSNASALFRSLLIYGFCLPLAVFLGYMLAVPNPLNLGTIGVVVVVFAVLTVPLLLRWHHAWLIATWNTTAMLFFIPGKPPVWMGLAAASFAICILQYTLNRRMKFLHVPSLVRPLLFLTIVVLLTARLTGGLGAKVFGGDTFGGRRYFTILAAVLGFFAIINRPIPPKRAVLYVTLFFIGDASMAIANLPGLISPAFNFIFLMFPVASLSAFTDQNSVVAPVGLGRIAGYSSIGLAVYCVLLARYGIRGVLDTAKLWRFILFCSCIVLSTGAGYRGVAITIIMTFAFLFYLEGLHHTRLVVPLILMLLVGAGGLILFANRLPYMVQRSLSFLPLPIDPLVKMDAEGSSEWRLRMWREVVPEIPQHLIVGKGYAFSSTELHQLLGRLEGTELVGNYHNGPLSVILPFGIFGSIAFVWLIVAGLRVMYQNYRYGDPAYHHMNIFLMAYFTAKVVFFFFVFGSLHGDLVMFLGLLGLSVSLNGGVAKPAVVPQPKIVFNRFRLHPSVRRPLGA